MKKKILLSILALTLCVGVGAYLKSNAAGWMWGGGTEQQPDSDPGNWDGTNTNFGWINTGCDSKVDSNSDGNIDDTDENLKVCDEPTGADLKSCNGDGKIFCSGAANCKPACDVLSARGINYGVNIPSADGSVTGYAWSENIGYIDFAPIGPYPTVASGDDYAYAAQRSGNFLRGWARITGIKTEYEKIPSNSGGWEGWIRLSSDSSDPVQYSVDIAKMDGTGSNPTYGWSNELGWVDFSRIALVSAPTVTLTAGPDQVVLAEGESLATSNKTTTLTWTVTGMATSCTASGGNAGDDWAGPGKSVTGGNQSVEVTEVSNTYSIQCCNGSTCSPVINATVSAGCYNRECMEETCPAAPGIFIPSDTNASGDGCEVGCTNDTNCGNKSPWKEVAP